MRIFITGASGFIGSALTRELVEHGHDVLGLARSVEGAARIESIGGKVHRGTIEDLDSVIAGAREADATAHLAFNHDFTRFAQNCEDDRNLIEALGASLVGTGKALVAASGVAIAVPQPGQPIIETDPVVTSRTFSRAASEEALVSAAAQGVNTSAVRLAQIHDRRRQGLVSPLIQMGLARGEFVYVGDGSQRWPAAHLSDTARLFRLALEQAEPNARWNAVSEEGVAMRDIVETLGRHLSLPVRSITPDEAPEWFGPFAAFAQMDMPASSAITQARLGWKPKGPGMLEDLARLELETA